ncbi:MAG: hypothetical protein AAF849_06660 [Bacteroidota bacterium]
MSRIFLIFFAMALGSIHALAQTPDCEEELQVNNETEVINNRVQASNKVTVSRKLYDGEQLEVRGGQVIELLPGFETEYGVSVDAANGDCEGGEELCPIICQFIGVRDPSEDMCCFEWQDNPSLKRPMRRVCPDATTTYTLKIIKTNGTIETQNFTVEVEGVEFSQNPYYLCEGQNSVELALTESYASYEWAVIGGDGTPMTATSPTFTVSSAGTYGVTVTDDNGCELKGKVEVEAVSNPEVEIFSVATAICSGEELLLSIDESLVGTAVWYKDDVEVGQGESLEVSEAGEYSVEVVDPQGCNGAGVITITEDEKPVVTITKSSETACEGGTITLTANSDPDIQYIDWSTGADQVSIAAPAGEYSVTVTNNNGCQGTASITVDASTTPAPEIEISPSSTTICEGNTVTASVNVLSGSVSSYLWSTGETSNSITISEEGEYSVTAYSNDGCEVSASIEIFNFENIAEVVPAHIYISEGDESESVYALPNSEENNYTWSHDPMLNSSQINISELGSHSVTISTSQDCSATVDFQVSKFSTENISVCVNECTEIGVETSPLYRYKWSGSNIQNQNQSKIEICPKQPQRYTLDIFDNTQYLLESIVFIVDVKNFDFKIQPEPAILCSGGSITLSTNLDDEQSQNITWSNGESGASITVNVVGQYKATISSDECFVESEIEVITNDDCEKMSEWFTENGFSSTEVESYRQIGAPNIKNTNIEKDGDLIIHDYANLAVTIDGQEFNLYQSLLEEYEGSNADVFITSSENMCDNSNFNESIFNIVKEDFANSTKEEVRWVHVCLRADGTGVLFESSSNAAFLPPLCPPDILCPIRRSICLAARNYYKDGLLLRAFREAIGQQNNNITLCQWYKIVANSAANNNGSVTYSDGQWRLLFGRVAEAWVATEQSSGITGISLYPGGGHLSLKHQDLIIEKPFWKNRFGSFGIYNFTHRDVFPNSDRTARLRILSRTPPLRWSERVNLRILVEVKAGYDGRLFTDAVRPGINQLIRDRNAIPRSIRPHLLWLVVDKDVWDTNDRRRATNDIKSRLYRQRFNTSSYRVYQQAGYLRLGDGLNAEARKDVQGFTSELLNIYRNTGALECDCTFN